MRPNPLPTMVEDGTTIINAWISSDSAYAAEVLGRAGFDCVTIDAQHGMFGRETVVRLLQAVSTGPAVPFARSSSVDASEIGWLLDAGAYGIIAPAVDTPALADALVAACRYPPAGCRSYGPARGLLYGGPDYLRAASATIMPWAMIESAAAVENLVDICSTPGLFGIYLGPNDLALGLGIEPNPVIAGEVADIAHRMIATARASGIVTGLFCADGDEAARWADAGFDLVTPGNDMSFLRSAAAQRLHAVRREGLGRDRTDHPGGAVKATGY